MQNIFQSIIMFKEFSSFRYDWICINTNCFFDAHIFIIWLIFALSNGLKNGVYIREAKWQTLLSYLIYFILNKWHTQHDCNAVYFIC